MASYRNVYAEPTRWTRSGRFGHGRGSASASVAISIAAVGSVSVDGHHRLDRGVCRPDHQHVPAECVAWRCGGQGFRDGPLGRFHVFPVGGEHRERMLCVGQAPDGDQVCGRAGACAVPRLHEPLDRCLDILRLRRSDGDLHPHRRCRRPQSSKHFRLTPP
jgi:hypothetical protein